MVGPWTGFLFEGKSGAVVCGSDFELHWKLDARTNAAQAIYEKNVCVKDDDSFNKTRKLLSVHAMTLQINNHSTLTSQKKVF